MKVIRMSRKAFQLIIVALCFAAVSIQDAKANAFTVEDYNAELPAAGLPFMQRYPLTFYTGFAPRIESPNRIHFRAGRGNQVRLTGVLDEYTVLTYLYRLQKRYETYDQAVEAGMIAEASKFTGLSMLERFKKVVNSSAYGIRGITTNFESGDLSRAELYTESLRLIEKLNPGRVFRLQFDLKNEFDKWNKSEMVANLRSEGADFDSVRAYIEKNPKYSLTAANDILFGRVNIVNLTNSQKDALARAASAGVDGGAEFFASAFTLFEAVSGNRFNFRIVKNGAWTNAINCSTPSESCLLSYSEFTAIYPNGSVRQSQQDRKGNSINMIRNQAAMNFIDRPYHDMDHIRREAYYGWAPKMDWQGIGNGIHNAAVSHVLSVMPHLYDQLDIDRNYKVLWAVSRGPVSSGCIRAAAGHVWEIREIFPANKDALTNLTYYGNKSADYDLFDIDGDGELEVMGTDYIIAYSLKGPSGDAKRRGKSFNLDKVTKDGFYALLYGSNQFTKQVDGTYVFSNPYTTYFDGLGDGVSRPFSRQLIGDFVLYEQAYEKDKVQTYSMNRKHRDSLAVRNNFASVGKQMVRILGRISACGPFAAEMPNCYEAEFDAEFNSLLGKL